MGSTAMPSRTPRVVTYLIWVVVVLLAVGQPGAKGPAMAPSEVLGVHAGTENQGLQGKAYVALGDSISAGRFATAQDGTFAALGAEKLGMTLNLVARSGAKAAWALPQLGAVQAVHPALVTIELGTNDVGFNTPLDTFAAQYEAIVSGVSSPQARALFIGSGVRARPRRAAASPGQERGACHHWANLRAARRDLRHAERLLCRQ